MAEAAKTAAKKNRTTTKTTPLPTPESRPEAQPASAPSRDAIAKRAYELYLQRGSVSGYELEDWLAAEAELVAAAVDEGT
jgi:hypothetical protein